MMKWLRNLYRTVRVAGRGLVRGASAGQLPHRERGVLDADGTRIAYTVHGSGTSVVLLHGYSVDAALNWKMPGILSELARHFRVVAPDIRGHGRSDKPHDPRGYGTRMVEDILALLDHLQISRAHLVGYSMGGFILLKMMVQHPERFLSATLGGSGGLRENWPLWHWSDRLANLLDEGVPYLDANLAVGELALGRPFTTVEKAVINTLPDHNDSSAMAAVIKSWRELIVSEESLKHVEIPTHLIYGTREFPGVIDYIRELGEILPRAEVHEVPDTNHFDTLLAPIFLKEMTAFLKRQEHALENR